MMSRKTLLLLTLIAVGSYSLAQTIPQSYIEINNVRGRIMGTGNLIDVQNDDLAWEVPKDSGLSPLLQIALWIGGLDQNDDLHLAGQQYSIMGRDYWMGPLKLEDASIDEQTELRFEQIWNIKRTDIEAFLEHFDDPNYLIPAEFLTWPAHGSEGYSESLAPFVDMNGDGRYNPYDGDYPDIIGDQCLFFIFNDSYRNHTELDGEKLGLEVHAMVYAFDAPEDEYLNNTVFFHYDLYNRSDNDYSGTYLGLWNDWDIGYFWDDYVGCDVLHGTCYAFNGFPEDPNYGDNPPAQLCVVLGGPYMDPDGLDNQEYHGDCEDCSSYYAVNFNNGVVDDERLGLSGFIVPQSSSDAMGDATNASEAYDLLQSMWKGHHHVVFGGNGYPGTNGALGPACKYMYPGDSDPCNFGTYGLQPYGNYGEDGNYWTEAFVGNEPNDRRGLATVGPFSFKAGAVQPFDFAMTTVWKNEEHPALDRIGEAVDAVTKQYQKVFASVADHPALNEGGMSLYPNPSDGSTVVEGTGRLTVFNLLGQHLISRDVEGQATVTLPPGIYVVRMEHNNNVIVRKLVVK